MATKKEFWLLVAGSRDFTDYQLLTNILDKALSRKVTDGYDITILEGDARGADAMAGRYANERGFHCVRMPAQWNKYGNKAGFVRNEAMHKMLQEKEEKGCVCFWDGNSRGTENNFWLCANAGTNLRIVQYAGRKEASESFASTFPETTKAIFVG